MESSRAVTARLKRTYPCAPKREAISALILAQIKQFMDYRTNFFNKKNKKENIILIKNRLKK
jgi:hypothetical protein